MLGDFIDLNNRLFARFSADERRNIGIHTCPGGDRDSVHSADVPYNNLLPEMFKINAGYFLIQLASERDKDPVYESIGIRQVLERASARETALRVAVGALAKLLLRELGISVVGYVVELGGIAAPPLSMEVAVRDASPVYTLNPEADARIVAVTVP